MLRQYDTISKLQPLQTSLQHASGASTRSPFSEACCRGFGENFSWSHCARSYWRLPHFDFKMQCGQSRGQSVAAKVPTGKARLYNIVKHQEAENKGSNLPGPKLQQRATGWLLLWTIASLLRHNFHAGFEPGALRKLDRFRFRKNGPKTECYHTALLSPMYFFVA